jgi:quercetin dioxygenase-like cupin family protein
VRRYRLGRGEATDRWGSTGAAVTRLLETEGAAGVAFMRYAPGGVLGRHDTGLPQLFVVVDGEGWVSGADGAHLRIDAGEAAYWETGESHESGSDIGMTALIVQSTALDPETMLEPLP